LTGRSDRNAGVVRVGGVLLRPGLYRRVHPYARSTRDDTAPATTPGPSAPGRTTAAAARYIVLAPGRPLAVALVEQ